jgi:hypothetical protein
MKKKNRVFTVLVEVWAQDQREAWQFVETALSERIETHEDLSPQHVRVHTADGLHSAELT